MSDLGVHGRGDGGHFQVALLRKFIEGLDVLNDVDDLVLAWRDDSLGDAIEHKSVVGIRAVADAKGFRHSHSWRRIEVKIQGRL